MDHETIAALATPMGSSGIGIIRLSGKNAVSMADVIFARRQNPTPGGSAFTLQEALTHCLQYGHIIDPLNRQIVDEVLVAVMRAPHSYTMEDVVEIQSHSGHVVMSTILNLVLDQGARLAEPGEFTKRAYLNGRIDLSQAEAVADVIMARSESALQLATTHLTGRMREMVAHLLQTIVDIQVAFEARVEFSDDIDDRSDGSVDMDSVAQRLIEEVQRPIDELLDRYQQGHLLRDGVRLGIVGRPNVGKSSLLNHLLMKDKAIVTPIAGTTRDLIEDHTCIEGVPVLITDSAGLRPSTDPIEIIGIEKAHESIASSDIVLFVVDGTQPLSAEDDAVYALVKNRKHILCVNKIDLLQDRPPVVDTKTYPSARPVQVSAKTGEGMDDLKKAIKASCLLDLTIEPGRSIVPNQRQKRALENARDDIDQVLTGIGQGFTEELIISDLDRARVVLQQISGERVDDDLLDQIFNRFCIGK